MRFNEFRHPRYFLRKRGLSKNEIDSWGVDDRPKTDAIRMFSDHWEIIRRPYYRVYPSIEHLLLNADMQISGLQFRDQCLIPVAEKIGGRAIAMEFSESSSVAKSAILLGINIGSGVDALISMSLSESSIVTSILDLNESGLEESFLNLRESSDFKNDDAWDEQYKIFTVFTGACMLANDAMLIEPIVLNRDAIKYKTASLEQRKVMEDRAARLSGRGWAIGKGFEERCEISPHFRKSHLALFWTGKGRQTPRLQLRKGCLVKSRKAVEIPTGYRGEAKSEIAESL